MDAKQIDYNTGTGLFKAAGSVEINERGYKLTGAEALFYSKDKNRRVVVTGNPVLTGEGITLASEKMEMGFEKRTFTASGSVRIKREDIQATCENAVYKTVSKEIILNGSAQARQTGKSISAEKITLSQGLIKAEGRARLEMLLEDTNNNG
ncbi:MAG: LptA/OstA family protein [bacterium]|nr:LptA/OstA family protein [bacterium]